MNLENRASLHSGFRLVSQPKTASIQVGRRRGWDLNPCDLSVTGLATPRPTRLGNPGTSDLSHDSQLLSKQSALEGLKSAAWPMLAQGIFSID